MPTHAAGAVERRVGGSPAGEPVRRKVRGRGRSGSGDTAARRHDRHRATASSASAAHAFFPGGAWEYRRQLELPAEAAGSSVFLEFEGVYRDARVFVNGTLATHRPSGYRDFRCRWTTSCASGSPTSCGSRPAVATTAGGMREPASTGASGSSQRGGSICRPAACRLVTPELDEEVAAVAVAARCAICRSRHRAPFSGPSWWTPKARWWPWDGRR